MMKTKSSESSKYNDRFNAKICSQIKYILTDIKKSEIKVEKKSVCVYNGFIYIK
jgi:hypothetical protein